MPEPKPEGHREKSQPEQPKTAASESAEPEEPKLEEEVELDVELDNERVFKPDTVAAQEMDDASKKPEED